MNGVLDALSLLNVVDLLDGWIVGLWWRLRGKGVVRVEYTAPAGMSQARVERELRRKGIAVCGRGWRGFVDDHGQRARVLAMNVKGVQVGWAVWNLKRMGATVNGPSIRRGKG